MSLWRNSVADRGQCDLCIDDDSVHDAQVRDPEGRLPDARHVGDVSPAIRVVVQLVRDADDAEQGVDLPETRHLGEFRVVDER